MTISLYTLAITGPEKIPALLEFNGKSHLIFGPTDTGKSYIVECLRYCLGSKTVPKNIGYSEGYTLISLQIANSEGEAVTIFRNLTNGGEFIYSGSYHSPPQDGTSPLNQTIHELLLIWANSYGKKILSKAGKLTNFTVGDLRRVSIFDEIETLNNVVFDGEVTDVNNVRNKSAVAVFLTGTDDSEMVLPPSTDQRNIAKGHVEALSEQLAILRNEVPNGVTEKESEEELAKISSQLETINQYLKSNINELAILKREKAKIDSQNQELILRLSALNEARSRFLLLDKKYLNDLQRLQTIGTVASVISNFETRSCPLCLTDIQNQDSHELQDEHAQMLRQAAQAESIKISGLRDGLRIALMDINEDIQELREVLKIGKMKAQEVIDKHEALLLPQTPKSQNDLNVLTERKLFYALVNNNFGRINALQNRLVEMTGRTKRVKQVVRRDLSSSSTLVCIRVKQLLQEWGVPGVDSIYFDETVSDIEINQRKRTSYGKGKRGIFLTAYMVSLMEYAIDKGFPHLGIIVIDSPVVTYKDPKHSKTTDVSELLDEGVKDRFYTWLANRKENGQVIILENEDPHDELKEIFDVTEFLGPDVTYGRQGFFPIT